MHTSRDIHVWSVTEVGWSLMMSLISHNSIIYIWYHMVVKPMQADYSRPMAITGVIVLAVAVVATSASASAADHEFEGFGVATDFMFDTTTDVTVYSAADFPLVTDLAYDLELKAYSFNEVWAAQYYILLTHAQFWGIEIAPFSFIESEQRSSSVRFTVRTSYYNSNISAQAEEIISCGFPDASGLDMVCVATYENVTIAQVHVHMFVIYHQQLPYIHCRHVLQVLKGLCGKLNFIILSNVCLKMTLRT